MPPRKEPKEAVTYPASKRKPPPFKPHRPSKIVRTSTDSSESSGKTNLPPHKTVNTVDGQEKRASARAVSTAPHGSRAPPLTIEEFDMSDIDDASHNSSDDLPDDPLKATSAVRTRAPTRQKVNQAARNTVRDDDHDNDQQPLPEIEGSDISQALLLRIMHEHFESKSTQIDKHAIKVVQRYAEIFLRESVARAAMSQKSEMDAGVASQSDRGWLDKRDLEKIAGGIILDF